METWQLRAAFARRLSALYGREVPAYLSLVASTEQVNAEVLRARGQDAQRLGGVSRVSAERHGAIRVGSTRELGQVARLFAALGMHPVGFYDLRASGVPVVSTAFRPIDGRELELNPFRVFTSVLATDDQRYFAPDLAERIHRFVSHRELFSPRLLTLADGCAAEFGLPEDQATLFLDLLTEAFQLDPTPVDRVWHDELHAVSAVAADIAGGPSTHINHLTPRVLDIDALQDRMAARGIQMIDKIQGPPTWEGPDVLLRQTSFRALTEKRLFRTREGALVQGDQRVRFGEVEARGIALTPAGRQRYDQAMLDERHPESWGGFFPSTEHELFLAGLGVFTVAPVAQRARNGRVPQLSLASLVADGFVTLQPVVYEDFLPRSAAGIFNSNLDADGICSDAEEAGNYSPQWLQDALDVTLHDPDVLYRNAFEESWRAAARSLALPDDAIASRPSANSACPSSVQLA